MYSHLPPINIRVYALRIINHQVMMVKEQYLNQSIIKFPGGGLEYGEGTIDCLKREFLEELNAEIRIIDHYYTTDFFQKSAWDDRQVISIYYLIEMADDFPLTIHNDIGNFYFLSYEDLIQEELLPIDAIVVKKLHKDDLI